MTGWIRRFLAKRKQSKQLKKCRNEGHFLEHKGGMMVPHTLVEGVPVPSGPAAYWIYQCACGYNEANDMHLKSYRRTWEEAVALKNSHPQIKV